MFISMESFAVHPLELLTVNIYFTSVSLVVFNKNKGLLELELSIFSEGDQVYVLLGD